MTSVGVRGLEAQDDRILKKIGSLHEILEVYLISGGDEITDEAICRIINLPKLEQLIVILRQRPLNEVCLREIYKSKSLRDVQIDVEDHLVNEAQRRLAEMPNVSFWVF